MEILSVYCFHQAFREILNILTVQVLENEIVQNIVSKQEKWPCLVEKT